MKKILFVVFSFLWINSYAQKLSELPLTTTIGSPDWLIALKVGASTANRITVDNFRNYIFNSSGTGVIPMANGGTNANLTASNGALFYSTASTGSLTATSKAYWDAANGRLGLGNATPAEVLDVTGNIKSSGSVTTESINDNTSSILIDVTARNIIGGDGITTVINTANQQLLNQWQAIGTGTTSATNSMTFLNSASSQWLFFQDNKRIKYLDGNEGANKVLTSDANGVATWQSSTSIPFAGAMLTGVSFPVAASYSMASGDNDIYTVPLGKRAFIMTRVQAYNTTTVTVTSTYPQAKISGVYYRLGGGFSLGSNASTNPNIMLSSIVLDGGESISVNTNGTGVSIWFSVIQFDSSNALRSSRILSLANGNNTLFTVPAGKTYLNANFANNTGHIFSAGFFNNTGISVNYSIYVIPSGGSPEEKYKFYPTSAVANGSYSGSLSSTTLPNMSAGGMCVINSDSGSAGQFAWATYIVQ